MSDLPEKDEFTLQEAADYLGCDARTVSYHAAFNGLPLSVFVSDGLRVESGEPSACRFSALCRLDTTDARDFFARGEITRTVLHLLQRSPGDHWGYRNLADAFLGRVELNNGGFTYSYLPETENWTVKMESILVSRSALEGFLRNQQRAPHPVNGTSQPLLQIVRSNSEAPKAASSTKITCTFRVIADDQENQEWWNRRFRDCRRYGLEESRVSPGRGRRTSQWRPDLVAAWLIDKGKLDAKVVADLLRAHFDDCSDAADRLGRPPT